MSNLCVIPARGGSQRIPRKNIKNFLGKPIIAYSIEVAIASGLFDEVMVSTDDYEIAEIAIQYGAKVPFFRSEKTSDDYATTFDVINEVVNEYLKLEQNFDYICCLYACAPFVTGEVINRTFELMCAEDFDTVFPVVEFGFPIQRAFKKEGNRTQFENDEMALMRSQDLEKRYHDAGQFYWMQTKKIIDKKKLITNNSGSITISELESQDIDSLTDWKLAEIKYTTLKN